jgi:hypothetical protein
MIVIALLSILGLGLWAKFAEYWGDKREDKFREENPDVNLPFFD